METFKFNDKVKIPGDDNIWRIQGADGFGGYFIWCPATDQHLSRGPECLTLVQGERE